METLHANFLAPLLLGSYPLFIFYLFTRYRPAIAALISLSVAELMLPPLYTLHISPSWLNKWTLPPLTTGLLAFWFASKQLRRAHPFRGVEAIFALGIVAYVGATFTNTDALHYGPLTLPPASMKDLSGDLVRFFIDPWISFFLGRALFKSSRDLRDLCKVLLIVFLPYSLFILFEARMAPNLCLWTYGYSPGSFFVVIRWGGYRPLVYFKDGLQLSSYVLMCAITAAAMARSRMRVAQIPAKAAFLYIAIVLVICKSTGAIGYALFALPVVYFLSPKTVTRFAWVITAVFLVYPILRFLDVISVKPIADMFTGLNADRANSLMYRFNMEDALIEHSKQRLWWGWGDWGRNLLFDPRTGTQTSIPDGAVIIGISSHGMVGFYSYFFPFAYTILRATKYIKRIHSKVDRTLLAALAFNCAIILFDLIVNSAFFPIHMLMLGALYSLPLAIAKEEAAAREEAAWADQRPNELPQAFPVAGSH